jgi:hypothetical protein
MAGDKIWANTTTGKEKARQIMISGGLNTEYFQLLQRLA